MGDVRAVPDPGAVPGAAAMPGAGLAVPQPLRRVLTVGGCETAVFDYGRPQDPVVLAIHGFRGTHSGLAPLSHALVARGYRVLAPDLPGSGSSAALSSRHDTPGYAAWLTELTELTARLAHPPLLLGHSFGSVLAAAAIADGAPARGAVLINPILTPPLAGPKRAATAIARAYYALALRLPDVLGRGLLGSRTIAEIGGAFMTSSSDPGLRRWIRLEHRRQASAFATREAVFEAFAASTSTTVADYAHGISCPALVVGADRDPLSTPAACSAEHSGITTGTFHVLAGLGHLLPYEAPAEAADLVAEWDHATAEERAASGQRSAPGERARYEEGARSGERAPAEELRGSGERRVLDERA